ncbi:MAG: glycosyl hydrolase [Gemmatimonadetes bacterium]|nr:glycosyl hydrolase [Gemmatimonadota bacterium]
MFASSRDTRRLALVALAVVPWYVVPAHRAEAQTYSSELFDALEWTNLGPARGGRSTAGAGSDARPLEYYFGATGGGLWKTTDGGTTWRPVTDGQINSASVGAVQVCEADPDVVYIGMGETQLRGNIQQGDGVYKSTDGGETWTHMGLTETQNISRIRIHPQNCNTVWVAAFGKHSIENPERGVFKTTNGGITWRKVLYRDERSGAVDLTLDPSNPAVMYASLWEAWRKSWGASSGGPGSGLFKSVDFGETWMEITQNDGLPQGMIGKVGVALSPAAPHRVWALIEADDGGLFRSDDAGATWERINEQRNLRQRAFYYTRIYADPQDPDVMYALNTRLYRSRDGGVTFRPIRVPHGDNHDLWIAPSDPNRMINANDGGANVSFNGGESWTAQDYSTAQFYRVMTTNHTPYMICGGQQDNSTACIPSKGWNHLSNTAGGPGFLFSVGGCESGYVANSSADPNIFFAGCYGGSLSRYNHANGEQRLVNVWPDNPMGQSSEDLIERVQWTFPIVFSNHDAKVLYTGTQKLWKTTTDGMSWEQLSPDLTRAAPETIGPSGGPLTKDQTGVETYATVFAIAPSYHDPNVIWVGSDDGLVNVTRDGGATWNDVTPSDAPDFIRINTIEASPNTPGKAYVSGIRYLVDDDRSPYVWKTDDYGETWTKIVNGFPEDDFIRAVREDPTRPGLLFAASERTVYASWDDGANWQPLSLNLPVLQVSDLVVEENDLVIATHGRSFWVMFNMAPLRQLNEQVASAGVHLFDPADPIRGIDNSAEIFYYLSEDAEELTMEFLDSQGQVIQTYEGSTEPQDEPEGGFGGGGFGFGGGDASPTITAGSHSFRWNLRYPGYTDFDGRIFWAAGDQGPRAIPGQYQVRLTVAGESQTQDFEVKLDPRMEHVTVAELRERFEFALRIRDRVSQANEAVIEIRRIKGDVDDRLGQTQDEQIHDQGGLVTDNLSLVESEIYQVRNESNQDPLNFPIKLNNKLAALMGTVDRGESGPTTQAYQVFDRLSGLLQTELIRMNEIIEQDLRRLNQLLQEEGLDPIEIEELIGDR